MNKYTIITKYGVYPHLACSLEQAYKDCKKTGVKEYMNAKIEKGWTK